VGLNLLELLGAFAHFTLLVSVFFLLISVFKRWWFLAGSSLLSALICGLLIAPHFSSIKTSEEASFTIGQFNLYHHNPSPEDAIKQILSLNADVISIQELNSGWAGLVDSLIRPVYPYTIEDPSDNCCYGTGFYSKYPITESAIKILDGIPAVFAIVDINGSPARLISLHTYTPVFPNQTEERNNQLQAVAAFVKEEKLPSIVFGDFNVVPWESAFQAFLIAGNLQEVACGFQATYPLDLGCPLIPIDHINYTAEIEPTDCGSIAVAGSDHKAIYASFIFTD
jgi:endonuclease/exonuclease/phosphatase (EEP) superfamily protein YafD